jgi:hypothetical protein
MVMDIRKIFIKNLIKKPIMNNQKLGVVIILLSLVIGFVIFNFMGSIRAQANDLGCYENEGCMKLESNLTMGHIAFGVIGFIFALGFYLLIFSKGEQAIIRRLDEQKTERSEDEKFDLLLKGLDSYDKKVMKLLKENPGITQSTLQIKSDMSKAKLSYVLTDLEKKNLVKREKKGKTYSVYLK